MTTDLTEVEVIIGRDLYEQAVALAAPGHPAFGRSWDDLTERQKTAWIGADAARLAGKVRPIIRRQVAEEIAEALADEAGRVSDEEGAGAAAGHAITGAVGAYWDARGIALRIGGE